MKLLVAIGFAAFFVSSLAIGCKLLWLARRNRGLPELLIGLSILGIGPAGFALTIFALLAGGRPTLVFAILASAQLAIAAGSLCAYLFTGTCSGASRAWRAAVVLAAIRLRGELRRPRLSRRLRAAGCASIPGSSPRRQRDPVYVVVQLRRCATTR